MIQSIYPIFALICVTAIAVGQLMFKKVGVLLNTHSVYSKEVILLTLASFALYGISSLLWIFVLKYVPLNKAYIFMSLSLVLVPLFAYLFLGETVSVTTIVGYSFVVIGVIIATVFK